MLTQVVVHTPDPDAAAASAELIAQARQQFGDRDPHAGLLFMAMDLDHETIVDALHGAFPDLSLIGCTTDGEFSSVAGFHEDSTLLILWHADQLQIRAGWGPNLSGDPEEAARQAIASATRPGDGPVRMCLTLPDCLLASGDQVVRALHDTLGDQAVLAGGAAADQRVFRQCRVVCHGEVRQDGLPVLLFRGPMEVGVGWGSGWKPIGEPVCVDEAEGGLVRRIGGSTALAFYQQYMGSHVLPDPEYPLMLLSPTDSGHTMRAPLVFNAEQGTIQFAGDVPQGSQVQLAEADRGAVLDACTHSAREARQALGEGPVEGAVMFSCASRRIVLGTDASEEIARTRAGLDSPVPFAGFYTYGEITPESGGARFVSFHNDTFVTVLFREGER